MKVGLTGGIATGKSTVSELLVQRGALLVDADQIARDVVMPGTPLLAEITTFFRDAYGVELLQADGSLHRKPLGELVFANSEAKKQLEQRIHPAIRAEILRRLETLDREHPELVILADIPLLFESKYNGVFDHVVLVYVSPEIQLQRLMQRDTLSFEQAAQRLAAQMPIDRKRELADVIIDNSGTIAHTERQIEQYWRSLKLHDQND